MLMEEDHMRNAQLKPGYNVQIGVESEYIVVGDVFQDRTDFGTLIPFLPHLKNQRPIEYGKSDASNGISAGAKT